MNYNLDLFRKRYSTCVEKNGRRVSREEKLTLIRFVDLEKAFDKVPKKSCRADNEKEIPEMMVKVVMSLYKD